MKILHLPHGYWPATGGAERLGEGWSEGLAARGHAVRVAVADLETPEGLYRFGIPATGRANEQRKGVDIHRIGIDPSYRVGSALFRRDPYAAAAVARRIRRRVRDQLTRALRAEIEEFQPDLVLTLPHLFENVRAVLDLHREMGFPLVWAPLLHESDPYWPMAEIQEHIQSADALVTMTPSERQRLVDGYGAEANRVHVVPPGISVPPPPPDPPDSPPTILFLGRTSHSKGLDILAAAMRMVWSHMPNATLVIAGAPTADTPQIREIFSTADAPSPGSVVFLENISEERKAHLLQSATVLVLPSVRESFGIVLLEAWANGTPVVTIDSPVMSDIVTDGVDGHLVPAGSNQRLAEALVTRLVDVAGSRTMGLAGYERIRLEYSWSTAAQRLEGIYEEVISRRSQDPS